MPRKSIYFTDELLPRALAAAELDDRSLSAWTMLAVEAKLAAGSAVLSGEAERELMARAPTSVPDADVLRAASALPKAHLDPRQKALNDAKERHRNAK